jgi:TonB-linked SusC/RagA family outer membrane protein
MKNFLTTILFIILSFGLVQAQDDIRGVVRDDSGDALPGSTVFVRGTPIATSADAEGNFSFKAPKDFPFTITINLIGYKTQEVEVYELSQEALDVTLKMDNVLDEIVVVGYGTQKREDFTGSLASVPIELKSQPVSSPERLLQGSISGIQVTQSTGQPGGSVSIRVRGGTSITAGNEPLYVIDGFPVYNSESSSDAGVTNGPKINPMSNINSSDIESIDVLKDASATAIYGSRGANGVIIITTKKGRHNESSLSYDGYYGIQRVVNTISLLNAEQWGALKNDALKDSGKAPLYTDEQLSQLGKGTDWQDEAFRTAPIQNHSLSLSTGTDKTTIALSGNYFNQQGILVNTGFDRYSGRVNIDHEINDRFKVAAFLTGSVTKADVAPDAVVPAILQMPPVIPVRDENGDFIQRSTFETTVGNPINTLYNQINQTTTKRFLLNGFGEYKVIEGLVVKVLLGSDFINNKQNRYMPSTVFEGLPGGIASVGALSSTNWLNENTISYKKQLNADHSIDAVIGNTQQQFIAESSVASSSAFVNDLLTYNDLGSGSVLGQGRSNKNKWTLQSYLGRINYSFKERYLLTLTVRADGSSRFGRKNKWGTFPSAAIAWNATKEDFIKNISQISLLKFRLSAGLTGNQEIDTYRSIARLAYLRYIFSNTLVAGFAPNSYGNADLGWEKTTQYDFGIDVGLFSNRINLVTDIYYKKTNDLLLEVPVPYTSGLESAFQNLGSVENKGIELGLNTKNLTGRLQWSTNLIFSSNRNKVLSLGPTITEFYPIDPTNVPRPSGIVKVGESLGSFYMYKTNGVFQKGEDFTLSPLQNTKAGSQKYQDVNGDGKITQAGDRTIVGTSQPKFLAGITNTFRYYNFDLSIFFQSSYGNKIFNNTRAELETGTGFTGASGSLLNRWTPENTNTDMHRAVEDPSPTLSDRFVEDGSYVRLKNLSLGYTIPESITAKVRIRNLRVYVSAQNLLTWTNYTGFDPEVSRNGQNALNSGIDNGVYPNSKTILGGVSLSF